MNIENFLTNHKRGCLANKGENCTCGLFEARAELACLLTRQARLQAIDEQVNEAIEHITDWKNKAYPLDIFPEPDLKRAHELLKAGGMSLDVVSASAIRFTLGRVCEILAAALTKE